MAAWHHTAAGTAREALIEELYSSTRFMLSPPLPGYAGNLKDTIEALANTLRYGLLSVQIIRPAVFLREKTSLLYSRGTGIAEVAPGATLSWRTRFRPINDRLLSVLGGASVGSTRVHEQRLRYDRHRVNDLTYVSRQSHTLRTVRDPQARFLMLLAPTRQVYEPGAMSIRESRTSRMRSITRYRATPQATGLPAGDNPYRHYSRGSLAPRGGDVPSEDYDYTQDIEPGPVQPSAPNVPPSAGP